MKRAFRLFSIPVPAGLLCLFALFATTANTQMSHSDSRSAEVEGVKLRYLTAGKGPALILLHGYAETSRMWNRSLCWPSDSR